MSLINKTAHFVDNLLGNSSIELELKKSPTKNGKRVLQHTPKAINMMRKDIKTWKAALSAYSNPENPKAYPLQQLFTRIMDDGLLTSQVENRLNKVFSVDFVLKNPNGAINDEQTKILVESGVYRDLTKAALYAQYFGYNLIELNTYKDADGMMRISNELIPRENIIVSQGRFYPDYTEDKFIEYRNIREYGTWLLEFKSSEFPLLNKAVKHVLMKDFAQSCWGELCEIYGIPPRFMKTDTQNPTMLKRAEAMMRDMGAAAWMIIDEEESFEFAKGIETSGDVYKNLINLCNNEMSMLISGAIIAQDTVNGSRSKDESAQDVLWEKVMEDLVVSTDYWNKNIIPALRRIGLLTGELTIEYNVPEDLDALWTKVVAALPHYEIDPNWVKDKFGIEITGKKETGGAVLGLNHGEGFFV